ncbi:MAG: hypothetical protein HC906_11845 [Bacteroidales bacterium]|nr:hypothetical protein [Bacteroidales bacterium]
MKRIFFLITLIIPFYLTAQNEIPHLRNKGISRQLIVHGKPFLVLGGELHNSSSSSSDFMENVWPGLQKMNLNTVLSPVTWEMVEPEEGKYVFTELDKLVMQARNHQMKLVLLWFGSF